MEFSKYLGVAEGCSSSESGWTMYIVSPMHETNHHHHGVDDDIDEIHDDYYNMHHNEDSDDSMVSDASSGPSRQRGNPKRRSGLRRDHSKHHAVSKDLIMGKNQRQMEKLCDRRQRAGKEEEEYKNRNDNKARKTN